MESFRTRKPLLIDFYTIPCSWCDKLDKEFESPEVQALLPKFVLLKLHSSSPEAVAMGVDKFPRLIAGKPDAAFLLDHEGYVSASVLASKLRDSLRKR